MTSTTITTNWAQAQALADRVLAQFRKGLAGAKRQAGLESRDLRQEAILAAEEALRRHQEWRGDPLPLAFRITQCRAMRAGRGPRRGEAPEGWEPSHHDDPLAILMAREAAAKLQAHGLLEGVGAREGASAKTGKRRLARARGLAEAVLSGSSPQGSLFDLLGGEDGEC